MIYKFSNCAFGRLSAGINAAATEFTFAGGAEVLFPTDNFLVAVWNYSDYARLDLAKLAAKVEWMHVAVRTGANCTGITRAQEHSAAIDHNTVGKQYWALGVLPESLLNNLSLLSFVCPDDSVPVRLVPRLVDGSYVPSFEPFS